MAIPVDLILRGINAVMTDPAVQKIVDDIGEDMAAEAGSGFEYVSSPHQYMARGFVQVADGEGARRQAREAVLERVMSRRGR